MSWGHGYFADDGYTYGYYSETMPARMHWAALLQGHLTPLKKFRYLDAGCGQGLNLILAAAAHPEAEFVGIDFMPEHIAHATMLAERCGLKNVRFLEADFIELASDERKRAELGAFDYAVCHGISAWIAPKVKEALYSLISHVLTAGGVFYNSYNTHPGWLGTSPFQHLVLLEQEHHSGREAITQAMDLLTALDEQGAVVMKAYPSLKGRMASLKTQDPAYLVQEYNNHFWQPIFVSDMVEQLGAVKLDYLGSATLADNYTDSLPKALLALIEKQPSKKMKLQIQDYIINQAFRRDLYVKGKRHVWRGQLDALLAQIRVVTNPTVKRPEEQKPFSFDTGSLKLTGKFDLYSDLLDQCNQAQGKAIGEIKLANGGQNALYAVVKMVSLLMQGGWMSLSSDSTQNTRNLNQVISATAAAGGPYKYLSVPKALSAQGLTDIEMILVQAHLQKIKENDWPVYVQNQLARTGKALTKDGERVTDPQQAGAMLMNHIMSFKARLPWLIAQGAL